MATPIMSFTEFVVSKLEEQEELKNCNEDQLTNALWADHMGLLLAYDRAGNNRPVYVDEAVLREAVKKFLAAK